MSVGQEHDSGADDPDLIRLNKRSLFTPSASVAVEQHSAVPHVSRSTYGTAKVEGRLTSPNARVPEIITQRCGGITVKGHTLKSFAYTTDAVIIRNTNANAILAVYPFTGEPVITQALLTVAQMPLFVGVGGGTTTGPRVAELAMVAEMQGAADFLRQAVHEGAQHGRFIVLGQIAVALFALGLFLRKAVLAHDQLRQLRAAEGLVAVVEHFLVADHLHAGGERANLKQGNDRIGALGGQALNQAAGGEPGGIGLHVENDRFQPCRLGQTLTVLHLVFARSCNQNVDIPGGGSARADHAIVEADFIERKGNVLVGFRFNLHL